MICELTSLAFSLVVFAGTLWLSYRAANRARLYESAIRRHRDYRGDDRCWLDDEQLYQVLPEGYTPPDRDSSVELEMCQKFIVRRHNPKTEYVSPQRRIEELEAQLVVVQDLVRAQAERIAGLSEILTARAETPDGKRIAELEEEVRRLVDRCVHLKQTRGGLYW